MDIKAFYHGSLPAVSTQKPELSVQSSQGDFYPPSLVTADEIIDYVEIRSNNYQPAFDRLSSYPIRADRSAQDKGTIIDIWI
jgi:hypothetical protein